MADLATLHDAFGGRLLVAPSQTEPFLTDWRGKWTGRALAVAQPDTTRDVAAVMRWCHANRVPVVAQGGNTGLSGGATPDDSGEAIVLSLTRLNRVRQIDPVNNTLEVEAGVRLQAAQDAARRAGRLFPLSLAAEGSCTIGGNLATNAGGVQVLRYGNARELCLGLEVVTAEGEIWDGLRGLRKDNSGYALRDVFIGSEGTLGIITAAVLKLVPRPAQQVVAFVAVPSPQAAVTLLQLAQARAGASLSAFELMSDACVSLVEKHVDAARLPLAARSPWYVLIELSDETAALEGLLATALEDALATDAAVSTSLAQFEALWMLREGISEAQAREGASIKHDISLPISRIPAFVAATGAEIEGRFPNAQLVVFGHLGDGNLHYNVSPASRHVGEQAFLALEWPLNRLVHDAVLAHGGSISAEHGLGVLRRDEAFRTKSAVELKLMYALKAAFDPLGLMNPGKLLP